MCVWGCSEGCQGNSPGSNTKALLADTRRTLVRGGVTTCLLLVSCVEALAKEQKYRGQEENTNCKQEQNTKQIFLELAIKCVASAATRWQLVGSLTEVVGSSSSHQEKNIFIGSSARACSCSLFEDMGLRRGAMRVRLRVTL